MIDFHVHIGQFNNVYYDAHKVFSSIIKAKTEINTVYYSSTSTCRDDVELNKIEEEIAYAQSFKSKKLTVRPYLWAIPKYAEQKIDLFKTMGKFDYVGIKLHPQSHKWDLENKTHTDFLQNIFEYCHYYNKLILLHTGCSQETRPDRFLKYYLQFPNSKVILAHSNPIEITAQIINNFANVYCDIACMKDEEILSLKSKTTDIGKILFGSDFPLTNYFSRYLFSTRLSLTKQYKNDFNSLAKCKVLFNHRH